MKAAIVYTAETYERLDYYSWASVKVDDEGRDVAGAIKEYLKDLPVIRINAMEEGDPIFCEERDYSFEGKKQGTLTPIEPPDFASFDLLIFVFSHSSTEISESTKKAFSLFPDHVVLYPITYDNYGNNHDFTFNALRGAYPEKAFFSAYSPHGHFGADDATHVAGVCRAFLRTRKTSNGKFFPALFYDLTKIVEKKDCLLNRDLFVGFLFNPKDGEYIRQVFAETSKYEYSRYAREWSYWGVVLAKGEKIDAPSLKSLLPSSARYPNAAHYDLALLEYDEKIEERIQRVEELIQEGLFTDYGIADIPLTELRALLEKGYRPTAVRLRLYLNDTLEEYRAFLKEKGIMALSEVKVSPTARDGLLTTIASKKEERVSAYNVLYVYFQDQGDCVVAPYPLTDDPFTVNVGSWKYETTDFDSGVIRGYTWLFELTEEDKRKISELFLSRRKKCPK